jgi:hypothetical protein
VRVTSSSLVRPRVWAHVTSIAFALPLGAGQASAATEPHLVIRRDIWKSSSGACTVDIERASVTGVPAEVKARIDGLLARTLASQLPSSERTRSEWEASCKAIAENAPYVEKLGHPYGQDEGADWTPGLARGRWLSARLHVTAYAGGAHPSDSYTAITFDLGHEGYPVPRSGFYPNSRRARFNQLIFAARVALTKAFEPQNPLDAATIGYLRAETQALDIDASQILLMAAGVEVTGTESAEAGRNEIVNVVC